MALKRNLPVLLFTEFPDAKDSFFEVILHTNMLVNESLHEFKWKVVADHVIYQRELFDNIMPKTTSYVSSLRNPPDQLKSMFHYFDIDRYLQIKSNDPVSEFLRNMHKYPKVDSLPREITIRNRNAMSLGLEGEGRSSNNMEDNLIRGLDNFQIMLITEYMDESLILLRRHMCWDLSDILYLPTNVRTYSYKLIPIEPGLLQNHRNWSKADFALYEHYNDSLWKALSMQSSDFWDELRFYKIQQTKVQNFCSPIIAKIKDDLTMVEDIIMKNGTSHFQIPASRWGESTNINSIWCILNKLRILALRNILRVRQYPQLCKYVNYTNISPYMYEFNIDETREIVTLHPSYCKDKYLDFKFSLEILKQNSAYLWTS